VAAMNWVVYSVLLFLVVGFCVIILEQDGEER
jgi:hypothetical protein